VRLTARDTQIFEGLLHRRADSLGTLHERHWPTGARDTARRRLGVLVNAGYLHRNAIEHIPGALLHPEDHDSDWVPVYTLTPKAVSALRRRSLAGSLLRGRSITTEISEAAIMHQLAVNRVGELIGAALTADHRLELAGDRRHRPDATYQSLPDQAGCTTVMLEVDLGHYSRQRILGKLRTFLADPDAKGVLFACPTQTRAAWIARTLRAAHGDRIMDRVQVLSFAQLQDANTLRADLLPDAPASDPHAGAYTHLPRAA
jgi:hypothetical protein